MIGLELIARRWALLERRLVRQGASWSRNGKQEVFSRSCRSTHSAICNYNGELNGKELPLNIAFDSYKNEQESNVKVEQ